MDRGPITLPLIAFYGLEPDRMEARDRMNRMIARIYGTRTKERDHEDALLSEALPGRNGRARALHLIDQRSAAIIDTAAAPLEYLASAKLLESKEDEPGAGLVRLTTGLRFRDVMTGAGVAGLKSASLEGASGGSGAGRPVSEFKVDCMKSIGVIRERMPNGLYRLFERAVWLDEWVWEKKTRVKGKDGKRKIVTVVDRKTILDLQRALDHAAVVFGYVTRDKFDLRWRPDHIEARRAEKAKVSASPPGR